MVERGKYWKRIFSWQSGSSFVPMETTQACRGEVYQKGEQERRSPLNLASRLELALAHDTL